MFTHSLCTGAIGKDSLELMAWAIRKLTRTLVVLTRLTSAEPFPNHSLVCFAIATILDDSQSNSPFKIAQLTGGTLFGQSL